MKIAISSTGKAMDSLLDLRFGRCAYFVIYNTESKKADVIQNNGQLSGGGAGIAAAQQIINEDIDLIITGNLGPNAFELINKAGIKVYRGESISIGDALDKYKNGELIELEESGPSHNGMGLRFRGGK